MRREPHVTTVADHLIARSNRLGTDLCNAKYARGTWQRGPSRATRTQMYPAEGTEFPKFVMGVLNQPTDGQIYF